MTYLFIEIRQFLDTLGKKTSDETSIPRLHLVRDVERSERAEALETRSKLPSAEPGNSTGSAKFGVYSEGRSAHISKDIARRNIYVAINTPYTRACRLLSGQFGE